MNPDPEYQLDYGPTLRGLRAGMKAFQRYTLKRKLGQGGMGVVWLAHDERLDLEVALKFLPENLAHDEAALDDLRRETRRCMRLNHPHIVRVYDLVEGGEGDTAAIAMEYVEGKSLSGLRLEKPNRVFEVADIAPWIRQVCEALEYAHTEGKVVHRDLKPANLMVDARGNVRVMDFGIASSLGDSMSRLSKASQARSGGGTLPYMSPQQLMGYPPSVSDDVYSLGTTIYELLTGKPPFFRGGDIGISRQIESQIPPSMTERRKELEATGVTEIPPVWEETVVACLEKDVQKRPSTLMQIRQSIDDHQTAAKSSSFATASSDRPTDSSKEKARTIASSASEGPSDRTLQVLFLLVMAASLTWLGWLILGHASSEDKASTNTSELITMPESPQEVEKKWQQLAEEDRRTTVKTSATDYSPLGSNPLSATSPAVKAADFNSGKIGDTRVVDLGGGVKMTLCYCPPGNFTMGSPASELGRSDDEDQVQVKISRAFWLSQTECTQAQWRVVMGAVLGEYQGDDLPVDFASWEKAQEFVTKLNNKNALPHGWKWSLPTEAQWEYACRAGTVGPYAGELDQMGWYGDNSDRIHPVGMKAANAWGLYDMHGNVLEWCSDWYSSKLPGGTDPVGVSRGSGPVIRGGSSHHYGPSCRSAYRYWNSWNSPGFRPAVVSTD